ncbi:phenylalanine--tRNA ligase subunit alpha [Candidatus Woesearchaeota archaeon]|nr:phenylalanine--tRNA ligase subunit alpha [Candidatus Woesearchaeota archaeon]
MDITRLAESLHPLEQKVVPFISKCSSLRELMKLSGLSDAEAMRALQWLENKGALKITSKADEIIKLAENGKAYLEKGLPERRFLEAVKEGPVKMSDISAKAGLSKEEFSVCLGILKSKAAIDIDRGEVSATDHGLKVLSKDWLEEALLKRLSKEAVHPDDLSPEERFAYDVFSKRKDIIQTVVSRDKVFELTDIGKALSSADIKTGNSIERLNSDMLKDASWKDRSFRRYDVTINVPKIYAGRKQHYRAFLDHVRRKFLSLGFSEMFGPVVESAFWNMDALFMPQFHSARDIHDAYYVNEPKYAKLDEGVVDKVRQAHEHGFRTGSKGWQYKFDVQKTHETILRTQGTACSARTLASKELKIPGKYFGITRCFRYDVIDATHLPDFFQTEGIVVEEGLNFTHLKGLLKMFAEEFAETDQFKIRPAYFPFTEPSAELFAKHPDLGWIELGGSGIFRPELTGPLGVDVPVIAWGMGIDRIGMFNMGIKDIRHLFTPDLDVLKKVRFKF